MKSTYNSDAGPWQRKHEPQRLKEAMELKRPLATAYYPKEDLCQL